MGVRLLAFRQDLPGESMMMVGDPIHLVKEVRIGRRLFRFLIIPAGIRGIGGQILPARGLFETWLLTEKGAIDGHRKYPDATWQGTATELETLASELNAIAQIVRANP
jgi:hypothetical protein